MHQLTSSQPTRQRYGSTMAEEVVECFHCHQQFRRLKTIKFALISCPYCSGPNYQGDITNAARKLQFEQEVLNYQSQQGMNPAPGLENPYYHAVSSPVIVLPSPDRVGSTQKRREAIAEKHNPHSPHTLGNGEDNLKRNAAEDWAKSIEGLVKRDIEKANGPLYQLVNQLNHLINDLQETIRDQQQKIEQLDRKIHALQIPRKDKGEPSKTVPSSLGSNPQPETLGGCGGPSDVEGEALSQKADQLASPGPLTDWEETDHPPEEHKEECVGDGESGERNYNLSSLVRYSDTPEWVKKYNLLSLSGGRDEATSFASQYYAKEVAQTEASLNQSWVGQKECIYFEANSNTGSYWLISSLDQQQIPVYHIVPNKRKFRFMEGTLSAMEAYFDFQIAGTDNSQPFNPEDADTLKFQVIHPAEVLEVVPQQRWQLQNKGLLKFQPREGEST